VSGEITYWENVSIAFVMVDRLTILYPRQYTPSDWSFPMMTLRSVAPSSRTKTVSFSPPSFWPLQAPLPRSYLENISSTFFWEKSFALTYLNPFGVERLALFDVLRAAERLGAGVLGETSSVSQASESRRQSGQESDEGGGIHCGEG
jgi:hypothetical protein